LPCGSLNASLKSPLVSHRGTTRAFSNVFLRLRRPDPLVPLVDRFDVVEAAAGARDEFKIAIGAGDHQLRAEWEPGVRELPSHQRNQPLVRSARWDAPERLGVNLKSPSYFAPLKSASSPRLSRTMRSVSE
jgi:hypothetical protein